MKRIIFLVLAVAIPALMAAQNSAVEKLFDKYSGKEGVTTVSISPELFQIVKAMDINEIDDADIPFEKISSVKVLTIEDEEQWEGVNFYTEISKDLDVSKLQEVLTVNDGGEMVRIWMKVEKDEMSEFLLIVGGDDNVLVYITGNFNMNDMEELAESVDGDFDLNL